MEPKSPPNRACGLGARWPLCGRGLGLRAGAVTPQLCLAHPRRERVPGGRLLLPPRRMPQHRRLLCLYLCPRLPARTPRSLLPRSVPTLRPGPERVVLYQEKAGQGMGSLNSGWSLDAFWGRSLWGPGLRWEGRGWERTGGSRAWVAGQCLERNGPNPVGGWGLGREEPKTGRSGERAVEGHGPGEGAEEEVGRVLDSVPQTWTNAARRTSARAASVPTPTAPSSASVLRDTAPAPTSPPASVRGPRGPAPSPSAPGSLLCPLLLPSSPPPRPDCHLSSTPPYVLLCLPSSPLPPSDRPASPPRRG